MALALMQSTSYFPWAVSSGSKICSKQSGNYAKRAVIKVMCSSLQTPPVRVRTFSGLLGGVNNLCNMVNNKSHDFHSTLAAATSEKASPILPEGVTERAKELNKFFESLKFAEKASPIILPEGVMFTERAKQVINFAQNMAGQLGYTHDGTEMILFGLIGGDVLRDFEQNTDDIAAKVFYSMAINQRDVGRLVFDIACNRSLENPFTPRAIRVFELALAEAQELGHNYIGSEHLLLGLLRDGGGAANHVLRKLGACPINIRTKVMRMIKESAAEVVGDGSSGNHTPTLEYGANLTELAQEKKLHPVVGKQPLINTVIQILGRPSKNIPWLVGKTGVGKTSIVEGLAQRIADSDVPDFLINKKVITLDKRLLVHGSYGRFQERLKKLMEEIKESNEIILFIDDVDDLFFRLGKGRTIDPACKLIGALHRGELQCVIATDESEYPTYIKRYPTLERLFQPVEVPEATVDETIEILKGLRERYQNHYKVRYTDEALLAAANMSDQNLSHCCLPGTAIDVIDAAGLLVSHKHEKVVITDPELQDDLLCVREHRWMTKEVMGAWRDSYKDLSEDSMLWDQEMGHKIDMLEHKQRMEEMENNNKSESPIVTKAHIEDILLFWNFYM